MPWFDAVGFELAARFGDFQGVFIILLRLGADKSVADEAADQFGSGSGLRHEFVEGKQARAASCSQFPGELVRDGTGCQGQAPGEGFGPLPAVNGVKVVLDDFQRQVLVPLEGQDKAEPLDVLGRVLPVPGSGPLR